MRKLTSIIAVAFLAGGVAVGSSIGCTNARTSAGYEGYVYHDPIAVGKRVYVAAQVGPSSTGMVWRQYVENIDMRPKNYPEAYKILTKDNLNLSFKSHARISLKKSSVRQVVEKFGGDLWYKNNVQQQYRAIVREEVRTYQAYDVKGSSKKIAENILQTLRTSYMNTPILFESVSIGNIDYPLKVNLEIEAKLAAQQKLERKNIEERIAARDAKIRVTKANGLAKAQKIINGTLTRLYVQHEAIDAYKELAKSPNTTFIIAPTNPQGTGMPIIIGGDGK